MMKREEEMQEQPTSHSLQNRVLCEVDNRGEGRKEGRKGRKERWKEREQERESG